MSRFTTLTRMRLAYSLLASMPPFSRWQMPPASDVRFYPIGDLRTWGEYNRAPDGEHRIGINPHLITSLLPLLRVMAHEMVHLRQDILGRRPSTRDEQHNRTFYRLAALVCRECGFDVETF